MFAPNNCTVVILVHYKDYELNSVSQVVEIFDNPIGPPFEGFLELIPSDELANRAQVLHPLWPPLDGISYRIWLQCCKFMNILQSFSNNTGNRIFLLVHIFVGVCPVALWSELLYQSGNRDNRLFQFRFIPKIILAFETPFFNMSLTIEKAFCCLSKSSLHGGWLIGVTMPASFCVGLNQFDQWPKKATFLI